MIPPATNNSHQPGQALLARPTPNRDTPHDRPQQLHFAILLIVLIIIGLSCPSRARALHQAGASDIQTHFMSGGL